MLFLAVRTAAPQHVGFHHFEKNGGGAGQLPVLLDPDDETAAQLETTLPRSDQGQHERDIGTGDREEVSESGVAKVECRGGVDRARLR